MSRMFLRQSTQISGTHTYSDALSAGPGLQSNSYDLENNLNAIRSQLKRIMHSTGTGNWYDDVPLSPGTSSRRGLSQLGSDLKTVESKLFLFRTQTLTPVTVPVGQNWVVLNAGSGEVPGFPAAVSTLATGSIVSVLSSDVGAHHLDLVSGTSAILPKNLAVIVSALNGNPLQDSGGRDIYALLQAESGVSDGTVFNDTTGQVQLSFVVTNGSRTALSACNTPDIAGKAINYSYVRRTGFNNVPEDAFLDGVFVDAIFDVSGTVADIVTLDLALDNQVGAVTQAQNIDIRVSDGFSWNFADSVGTTNLFKIAPSSGGDIVQVSADRFDVRSGIAQFVSGVSVAVSGTRINVGSTAGVIDSSGPLTVRSTSANLILSGGTAVEFVDSYKLGSTYTGSFKFASSSADYSSFKTSFGETSLLRALQIMSSSIGTTSSTQRFDASVTVDASANTNMRGAVNLDASLGDYSTKNFVNEVKVYVNGNLKRNGADATANNDVYPGTTPSLGGLMVEFDLYAGDVVTMFIN